MSDLGELYQEVILDHNRNPRNLGRSANQTHHAEGYNPLCGDRVTVSLRLDGEQIEEVCFEGSGCAISTASASLMTEALKGLTVEEANRLFQSFHQLVRGESAGGAGEALGKLAVFHGVSEFPVRVKCATLAWHAVQAALSRQAATVSTE